MTIADILNAILNVLYGLGSHHPHWAMLDARHGEIITRHWRIIIQRRG